MPENEQIGMESFPDPAHALIVGGSRGLGLGFVRALLAQPRFAKVFAASREPLQSQDLLALAGAHSGRLVTLPLDVTNESSVMQAADTVRAAVSALHLLIDCAGVLHDGASLAPERRLADVRVESMLLSFQVNALGPLLLAKHFHGLLERAPRAVIANVSARVGSIGDNRLGSWYAYRVSKAAQNQVTHTISIELGRRAPNLICVALHPGTVDTELSRPFQAGVNPDSLLSPDYSAAQLLRVIDGLDRDANGRFYAWDGSEIPW
jgi:NAD(P)-dependent dehydrogenase (short-subunit alcohol dehydrogenase family)